MSNNADYKAEHWTSGKAEKNYKNQPPIEITVNDRAATRKAIISRVRQSNMEFIERSDWAAHKNKSQNMVNDWDYTKVVIHHAGRSFTCGPAALQMKQIQEDHMDAKIQPKDDFSYHYAVDCFGNIYEGRDIRFKGEHIADYNTGAIGIVILENLTEPGEGKGISSYITKAFSGMPSVPAHQAEAVQKLVTILKDFFPLTTLGGHREFPGQKTSGKICPGNIGIVLVNIIRNNVGLAAP